MVLGQSGPVRSAFPSEAPFERIVAAFTTRSLNNEQTVGNDLNAGLHAHDDPIRVAENRRRIFDMLGLNPDHFTSARQIHGDGIYRVTGEDRGKGATDYATAIPATDGLITDVADLPIGVFTADCVPVFLYDPRIPAVGIVHAGWRSTALSIVEKTVDRMKREFESKAESMWAAIGPSIGPCCYEVGADVVGKFRREFDYSDSLFRKTGKKKWHLDLWAANRFQLAKAGVREARVINHRLCSACDSDRYFSARKLGPQTGRTLSVIAIKS